MSPFSGTPTIHVEERACCGQHPTWKIELDVAVYPPFPDFAGTPTILVARRLILEDGSVVEDDLVGGSPRTYKPVAKEPHELKVAAQHSFDGGPGPKGGRPRGRAISRQMVYARILELMTQDAAEAWHAPSIADVAESFLMEPRDLRRILGSWSAKPGDGWLLAVLNAAGLEAAGGKARESIIDALKEKVVDIDRKQIGIRGEKPT